MKTARHILDAENQRFLDAVVQTSEHRKHVIKACVVMWRAQLGYGFITLDENGPEMASFRGPYPPERMRPKPDSAKKGRVNPKGIPYLYLSTDRYTAMTETRPWMGSLVTVAQFVMLRNLTVVDCTSTEPGDAWNSLSAAEPEAERREEFVWGYINMAFSQPVDRNDDVAEYAPTQFLAEAFRMKGYDGLMYRSRLGRGNTVALFDLDAARLVSRQLCRVEEVNLSYCDESTLYPP